MPRPSATCCDAWGTWRPRRSRRALRGTRTAGSPSWKRQRRAGRIQIGGELRWIALEDAALYRDALGTVPPPGVPDALLDRVEDALPQLAARFARRRGPFSAAEFAGRYALAREHVAALLGELVGRDRLLHGAFLPGGSAPEFCDPEVLRRIRRRSLARARAEVAPVESATLARFLGGRHGIGASRAARSTELRDVVAQLEGLPVSFAELERGILPARIGAYESRLLDELGATGEVVWIGRGALGARDGRVALYRRENVALLADSPPEAELEHPLARAVLEHLEVRGASFTAELWSALAPDAPDALRDALRELVWAGLVTNDTFGPLRALTSPRRVSRRPGRGADTHGAGRWSRVSSLVEPLPSDTERLHARARMLLARYGVVSRAAAHAEGIAGGFSGLYDVYREMEDAGQLRRGHFVEGLEGVQFAQAGSVDALRATPPEIGSPQVAVLAAVDPANPYGALVPWPATPAGSVPRRAAGASVVLAEGAPLLWLDRGGRRALSFEAPSGVLARAIAGLRELLFRDRRRGPLRLREIDGVPAAESPLRPELLDAGFRLDVDGLVLERFDSGRPARPPAAAARR